MAKVSDLKDRARAFERRGQIEQALTVYQHIIKHLEGTPDILPELPLYVKAGDLLLKLEDPEAGLAMYERAGEQLAAHGFAKNVIALCAKILGVASERTDVHLRYARQMVEAGHVAKARDILVYYAERAQLDEVLEALEQLQGRPDDEARPDLERLLKLAELGKPATTEVAEQRVSEETAPTLEPSWPAEAPRQMSRQVTLPRPSPFPPRPVWVTEERKRPAALWIGVAGAGIVIVGGAGLFLSGVIGGGSTRDEPPGDVASPLAVPAGDTSAALEGDSAVLIASLADAGAADTVVPPLADPVTEPANTAAPAPAPARPIPPRRPPRPPVVRRRVVVVDGLKVERVTQSSSEGGTAYRVIHVLDSGERLTLTSVAGPPADAGVAGLILVSDMPGDTAMGIVQFGRYTVNAHGKVPGAILEVLLGRLVEAIVTVSPPSN